METGALALIISPPGRLIDGWRALLLATPQIAEVRQVDGALPAIEAMEAFDPDLVLVDVEALGKQAWSVLAQIKRRRPRCCSILLVCYARQRQQALDAGADEVLVKGFSAGQLSAAVERLFTRGSQGCK